MVLTDKKEKKPNKRRELVIDKEWRKEKKLIGIEE